MPFVKTERGQFFYQEYGSIGPVLYLLHGLTAKSQDWGGIPDILAKVGFHVLVFDMRGHGSTFFHVSDGNSPRAANDEDYSPEGHAKDIAACAKVLGHDRIHLVGHSTGARNAMVFAGIYSSNTWTLTMIDQTLRADPESWKKYQGRYSEYPSPFDNEEALDKFLEKKFKTDARRFHYYKGQFWKRDDGKWDWNYSTQAAVETQRLGREKDQFDRLAKVKAPVLYIKGGDSKYIPMEEVEKIKKMLPTNSFFVTVARAEHAVFRDNAEGFLRVLVPFLLRQSQGHLFVAED